MRERALVDPIVRVKIWSETGKVVYSDEERLIGQTFALKEDQVEALDDDVVKAELSDLRGRRTSSRPTRGA